MKVDTDPDGRRVEDPAAGRDEDPDPMTGAAMVVGPFKTFEIGGGKRADLYLLRFAEDGSRQSPQTEQLLRNAIRGASDVFLFSHGWNNTFDAASHAYEQFINGYIAQRAQLGLTIPR